MSSTATALLILLIGPPHQNPASVPHVQGEIRTFQVSGRYNPELIPQQMLWEAFFRDLADEGGADTSRERRIAGLSKYTLTIPVEDVNIAIRIAVDTVKTIDELRTKLLPSDRGSKHLTMPDRKRLLAKSNDAAMQGRDELVRSLSPASFSAIRLYVTEELIKGIVVELPVDPQ